MNTKDRQTIISKIDVLSDQIDLSENLLNQLINKNVFTQQMVDNIMKIDPEMERKKCFLSDLTQRGPEAYDKFVEVLCGAGQIPAVQTLRPNFFESGLKQEEVVENIVVSSPLDAGGGGDIGCTNDIQSDHSQGGHTVATQPNEDLLVNVILCKKEMIGECIYRMKSNPRGFCVILNIFEFENKAYDKRDGSETEANLLRDVFRQLYFSVDIWDNPTKQKIISLLKDYSKNPELKKHDAFVLIVLSHGLSQYLITSDALGLPFEDIINMFNNENCPLLINKPKLFFFSCCRGAQYTEVMLRDVTVFAFRDTNSVLITDSRDTGPRYKPPDVDKNAVSDAQNLAKKMPKVPTVSDIMICYSTIDGYVSWRNEDTGSWFGTALSKSLMRHSHDTELHHIITFTSKTINNKETGDGERQAIETITRGFKKLFYFNPGIPPIHSSPFTD